MFDTLSDCGNILQPKVKRIYLIFQITHYVTGTNEAITKYWYHDIMQTFWAFHVND